MKMLPRFLLLTAVTMIALHGCKARTNSHSLKTTGKSADSEMAGIEMIRCTPEVCDGKDTVFFPLIQDFSDQTIAMELQNPSDATVQYALGDTAKSGAGTKANSPGAKKLEHATTLANLTKGFFNSPEGKSATAQFNVSTLFGSLSPMLQSASDLEAFTANNISGTADEKAKTLAQIKKMSADMAKYQGLGATNREQLLTAFDAFGGQDGWMNLGDEPRISAVVPWIASREGDRRIANELPQATANAQVYYRQQYLPFGGNFPVIGWIAGSIVDRKVATEAMNTAYGMKAAAVVNAGKKMKEEYIGLVTILGTTSYYLYQKNKLEPVSDPAPAVTEDQMATVVEGMTGKTLQYWVSNIQPNAPLFPPQLTMAAKELAKQVVLPDGIPTTEIHRLFRASEGFKKTVFPEGLRFKTLPDGRLEITRNTNKIDLDTVVSANDTTNKSGNPSQGDFSCTATTKQGADGKVTMFLYSGTPGVRLSILTSQGWFEMMTPNNSQPPTWQLVRSGGVEPAWLKTAQVRIRLETNDGVFKTCLGKIYHM